MNLTLADERYTCTGCGECCGGWSVPLLDGEADRFRAQAATLVPAERLTHAVGKARRGGVTVETLAGPGTRCITLAEDKRCLVHATHGAEAKPLGCRLFPFTFVATPADVRVGLSFACPAVVDGEGPPLAEQRDDIAGLHAAIATSPYQLRVEPTVALLPGRDLAWADAARLLDDVAAALAAGGTLVERICRGGAVVALTIAGLEEGRPFADALAGARGRRDALAAKALAAPPRVDRLSRALLRTIVDSTAPERSSGSRLVAALASLGRGGGRIRLADGDVAREAVERVARGLPAEGEALVVRWLRNELAALTFFGSAAFDLSLAGGLDLLTLMVAAVAWLARARAAHAGRAAVVFDDVKRALRQVYAGVHHRAAMPPRFERALAATACLDLLRAELSAG